MYAAQMCVFSISVGICPRRDLFRAHSVSVAGRVVGHILSEGREASEV